LSIQERTQKLELYRQEMNDFADFLRCFPLDYVAC
jgi:hypothetical protein